MKIGAIIIKNSGILIARQVFLNLLGLVMTGYAARCLGEVDYGRFAFAFAFVSLFRIVGGMGIYSLTVREVAKNPDTADRWLGDSILLRAFFSSFMLLLIFVVVHFMGYPTETRIVVYIAALSSLLDIFAGAFTAIFEGFQKMEFVAYLQAIGSLFQMSLAILILYLGFRLIPLVLVYLAGSTFTSVLGFFIAAKKFTLPRFEIDVQRLKRISYEAFPFALTAFFITVMFKLDIVLLSLLKGDAAAGWYNAATILPYNLIIITSSLSTSLFPAFSSLRKEDPRMAIKVFEKAFYFLLLVGLPAAVGTTFVSKELILLIFGARFEPSIFILQVIIWYVPVVYIGSLLANVLNAYERQKFVAKTAGVQAITNVLMNLILIPRFGPIGAAITTILTEIIGIAFLSWKIKEHFSFSFLRRRGPIVLICNVALSLFLVFLLGQNLAIVVPLSIIFYIVFLFVFRALDPDDLQFIKALIPKKFVRYRYMRSVR